MKTETYKQINNNIKNLINKLDPNPIMIGIAEGKLGIDWFAPVDANSLGSVVFANTDWDGDDRLEHGGFENQISNAIKVLYTAQAYADFIEANKKTEAPKYDIIKTAKAAKLYHDKSANNYAEYGKLELIDGKIGIKWTKDFVNSFLKSKFIN